MTLFAVIAIATVGFGGANPQRVSAEAEQQGGWVITPIVATASGFGYGAPQINDLGDVLFNDSADAILLAQGGVIHTIVKNGVPITHALDATSGVTVTINAMPFTLTDYLLDNQGRAYVLATTSDGRWWVLRWERGVFTRLPTDRTSTNSIETAFTPDLARGTRDGRWLEQTDVSAGTTRTQRYRLSNGLTTTAVVERISSNTAAPAPCEFLNASSNRFQTPSTTSQGVLIFRHEQTTASYNSVSTQCGTLNQETQRTAITTAGVQSATLSSAIRTRTGSPSTISGEQIVAPVPNDAGDVGYVRVIYANNTTQGYDLSIASGGSSRVVRTIPRTPLDFQQLFNVTPAGTLHARMTDNGVNGIYAISSAGVDRIVQNNQTLSGFGSIQLNTNTNSADGNAANEIVFSFQSTSGGITTFGLAKATRGVARWTNPAGGAWATAGNWSPAEVPGQASETLFDLANSYDVTVGARASGRSRIERGAVVWRGADLTLNGPLGIGNNATLTIPDGVVKPGELTVGSTSPQNPAAPQIARLTISNAGTRVDVGGSTKIGNAGDGELFVSGGVLSSTEALIGAGSTGTVTVGGSHATQWLNDNISIGAGHPATLNVERSAYVYTDGQAVVGGGANLSANTAIVAIDAGGSTASAPAAEWAVAKTLTIGDAMFGELHVRNGGKLLHSDGDEPIQVGTRTHNGGEMQPDGLIIVSGSGANRSGVRSFNGILFGMVDGAATRMEVRDGALSYVSASASLGHARGSTARLIVSGRSADGQRSEFVVGDVFTSTTDTRCMIGNDGTGFVRIEGGALFECRGKMFVGSLLGSRGLIVADGGADGVASTVRGFAVCVGRADFCGTPSSGGNGEIALRNGAVLGIDRYLVIGDGGRMTGSGNVFIDGLGMDVEDGGAIDPGVKVTDFGARAAAANADAVQPGMLTISGNVSISTAAVITIDVTSAASFDKLVINGNAKLGGKLVLNFSNGYAPNQGDVFAFLQNSDTTGNFASVEIKGLQPGFQFAVSTSSGQTRLTANNNGVAATQADARKLFLPITRRGA